MRFLAPYTRATLRGIYYYRGPNSTSAPLSCVVNTNIKCLCLRRRPFLQPVDIPADIPSASRTKTLKEEKVNIIKDLLY